MYCGIEQLRGSSNYDTWRHYARALLLFDDLADHLTDSVEQQLVDEREEWLRQDARTQCTITLTLSPVVLHLVDGDRTSAKQMWDKLAATYSLPSAAKGPASGR